MLSMVRRAMAVQNRLICEQHLSHAHELPTAPNRRSGVAERRNLYYAL
jgi:hypothetical protein